MMNDVSQFDKFDNKVLQHSRNYSHLRWTDDRNNRKVTVIAAVKGTAEKTIPY